MGRRKKSKPATSVVVETPVDVSDAMVNPPDIPIVWIQLANIQAHELNPNVQKDEVFNHLVEEIEQWGFDEPIIVVPVGEWDGKTKTVRGKTQIADASARFKIVSGEHRFKALRVQGWTLVPCIIKDWDEYWQKIELVRRNNLRGEFDQEKFGRLVKDLQGEHGIDVKDMPSSMGFVSAKDFGRYLKEERKKAEASTTIEDKGEAESAVENLAWVLNEIMSESGATIPQGFVFFMYKKKMHLLVNMDEELEATVTKLAKALSLNKESIREFLTGAISANMPEAGEDDLEDDLIDDE